MREKFVEWPHELLCSTLKIRFTQSERPKWRAHLVFFLLASSFWISLFDGVHSIFKNEKKIHFSRMYADDDVDDENLLKKH